MSSSAVTLQEHRIRPSAQRVQILDYIKSVHSHPSVDTIYKALLPENPGLSRTTVYNTLELFAKHGLILSLDFGEGYLRYDGEIKPHTHFKCEKCGAVSDIFTIPENCEKMLPERRLAVPVREVRRLQQVNPRPERRLHYFI